MASHLTSTEQPGLLGVVSESNNVAMTCHDGGADMPWQNSTNDEKKKQEAMTLNVVLSEPGAFTGGGTAFWSQAHESNARVVQGAVNIC